MADGFSFSLILMFSEYNIFLLCDIHPLPNENFAGGLLLSVLATTSSVLDHYLRRRNAGFAIGFTSILIIVSAVRVSVI